MASDQRSHNFKPPEENHGGMRIILVFSRQTTFIVDNFTQYTDMALGNVESHNEKFFSFHSLFSPCDSVRERLSLVLVFNL